MVVAFDGHVSETGAERREALYRVRWLEEAALPWLSDGRDRIMVSVLANVLMLLVPAVVTLYVVVPAAAAIYLAPIVYGAMMVAFGARFILTLHYTSHRRLFGGDGVGAWLANQVVPFVIAPFFGIPPGQYRLHHCVMHHCESNLFPADLSSTEPYDRSSFLHFGFYWCRYLFAIWYAPPPPRCCRGFHARMLPSWTVSPGSHARRPTFLRVCVRGLVSLFVSLFSVVRVPGWSFPFMRCGKAATAWRLSRCSARRVTSWW